MAGFQVVNDKNQINLSRRWKDSPGFEKGKEVVRSGIKYEIIAEKERERGVVEMIGRVALGVIFLLCSLFTGLMCPFIMDHFSSKEVIQFAIEASAKQDKEFLEFENTEEIVQFAVDVPSKQDKESLEIAAKLAAAAKIDRIFEAVKSAGLEVLQTKSGKAVKTRNDFWQLSQDEAYNPAPPVLSKSSFVPDQFVEHLMRNKKNSALGVKYKPGDAITNMEGAMHTFLTPLAKIYLTGDYIWHGYHDVQLFKSNLVRPVILSAAIQPDFEFGNVMAALIRIGDESVKGVPLPDDFKIPGATDKKKDDLREAYDAELRSHLIYHLTGHKSLPALSEIPEQDKLQKDQAVAFLEKLIETGGFSEVSRKYLAINHSGTDYVFSLEMLFNSYLQQISNEFKVVEMGAPQGYVYTIDPPSIFVNLFGGDATLFNRLQILAFKKINELSPLKKLKIVGFNDYIDKKAIDLFKKALPSIEIMNKGEALAKLQNTNYALVIHNNSDAFGQNIETEGPNSSMDGVVGCYSDAALVLKRTRADLLNIIVP